MVVAGVVARLVALRLRAKFGRAVEEAMSQLTKEYPARLIVSDSLMAALGTGAGAARPLGTVAVKGYAEPIPIWGLD